MKSAAITQRVKIGKQVSMILDCVHQTKQGPWPSRADSAVVIE
jgi:hypothetical protein